jgi:hypothetical protein
LVGVDVLNQLGLGLDAGPAQGFGLGLAASLRNRLGEIREQEREPKPQDDLEREAQALSTCSDIAQEEHRHQQADDLDNEYAGFPIKTRGSSFLKEAPMAGTMMELSRTLIDLAFVIRASRKTFLSALAWRPDSACRLE